MIKLTILVIALAAQGYATIDSYGYANSGKIIPAAVKSQWRLHINPVQLPQEPIVPQVIEVPALELPVKILYNSKSSGVFVQQVHHPGSPGQAESTKSEEEPHRVSHEVIRPVIQELREVIVPYRRVVQEIAPVVEDVQTVVAQGQQRQVQGLSGGVLPSLTGGVGAGTGLGLGGGLSGANLDSLFSGLGGGAGGQEGGKGSINVYGGKSHGIGSVSASAAGGAAAKKA